MTHSQLIQSTKPREFELLYALRVSILKKPKFRISNIKKILFSIFNFICLPSSKQLAFYIPQRYWLTFMGFLGLVMAYSLRLSLSVAITQMVPPPIFNTANLTNANGEMEIICPFNDSNYIHEHFDYVAIFDSLYSVR